MIRAVPIRILRQVLLVIVDAEAISCTEITDLSSCGYVVGTVSVDVDVNPPVDPHGIWPHQWRYSTPMSRPRRGCSTPAILAWAQRVRFSASFG